MNQTSSPTLIGPCCKGRFMLTPGEAQCEMCQTKYTFAEFPAFRAERVVTRPRVLDGSDDATCFFHTKNQAEKVCAACGRFLCPVCAVDFGGRTLCPTCIASGNTSAERGQAEKWQPDGIALLLASAPLIMWPVTLVTAPAAFVFVLFSWRKPADVVPRIRWQRWVAGALSLVQMAGWAWFFVTLYSR